MLFLWAVSGFPTHFRLRGKGPRESIDRAEAEGSWLKVPQDQNDRVYSISIPLSIRRTKDSAGVPIKLKCFSNKILEITPNRKWKQ